MSNELLFFLMVILTLGFVLIAFRLGKVWVYGLIAAIVVLMNIFVTKSMTLFGLDVTGGNVLYAAIFLATDALAEHYGKAEAKRAVRIGFFVSLFFLAASQFFVKFSPNEFDFVHEGMVNIFTLAPRIVTGSLIAYLISQHFDVWFFHKIKSWTKGKFLWLRNNGSTWASQAVDTVLFTLIAFWGVFPSIWEIILFTYIIKIIVAALDTPFLYLTYLLKPKELKKSS